MSRATHSLPRTIGAHAILIAYTVIALFPVVLVIVNSSVAAGDLREPMMPPTAGPSTYRYVNRVKRAFLLYFQNSLIVTWPRCSSCCCSAPWPPLPAEYRFRGNTLLGSIFALGS